MLPPATPLGEPPAVSEDALGAPMSVRCGASAPGGTQRRERRTAVPIPRRDLEVSFPSPAPPPALAVPGHLPEARHLGDCVDP